MGSVVAISQTNTEVLDRCRQAVAGEAGHLGGAGDTLTADCPMTIFGKLDGSGQLAAAVNASEGRMRTELAAAERLLHLVEQALGAVESAVRETDDEAAHGMSVAVA